jgi:hypothetical protein
MATSLRVRTAGAYRGESSLETAVSWEREHGSRRHSRHAQFLFFYMKNYVRAGPQICKFDLKCVSSNTGHIRAKIKFT